MQLTMTFLNCIVEVAQVILTIQVCSQQVSNENVVYTVN